jgi:hypothetical protein
VIDMRILIGFDSRPAEREAYDVAAHTARRYGCDVAPVHEDRLRMAGLLYRPTDRRGGIWDMNSDAPCATEFAISRFFAPILAMGGWCLFVDADVVFLDDPRKLMRYADARMAVHVVKHAAMAVGAESKMDGQIQTSYPRKNWSSVVLWNCDHPANQRVNLTMLNQWPGRMLHAFGWLHDDEIGELPAEANWLVGLQPKPAHPMIAHFTLGTPNMPGLENCEHAELWLKERDALGRAA